MVKKSPCPPSGYFGYEYELTIQFNTVYNSFCACLRLANRRILCFIKIFLENSPLCVGSFENAVLRVTKGEIKQSPAFAVAKGGDTMNEPNRTQWQIRCAFNGFCKRALKNEAINAHGEIKRRQLQEVSFSDLTPQEENQLYTYDTYFEHDEAEKSFCVAGKEITAKLLAEALHSLPDDKREAVLLYYFFDMNDAEIAKLHDIPRSTVQYRRTSSFELLKRYLEERAYDCT